MMIALSCEQHSYLVGSLILLSDRTAAVNTRVVIESHFDISILVLHLLQLTAGLVLDQTSLDLVLLHLLLLGCGLVHPLLGLGRNQHLLLLGHEHVDVVDERLVKGHDVVQCLQLVHVVLHSILL